MSCSDDTAAIETAITNALTGPAEVSGDAGSVRSHNVVDLIAVDKYLLAKCAVQNKGRGLYFNRLIPAGTTGRRYRGTTGGTWGWYGEY